MRIDANRAQRRRVRGKFAVETPQQDRDRFETSKFDIFVRECAAELAALQGIKGDSCSSGHPRATASRYSRNGNLRCYLRCIFRGNGGCVTPA